MADITEWTGVEPPKRKPLTKQEEPNLSAWTGPPPAKTSLSPAWAGKVPEPKKAPQFTMPKWLESTMTPQGLISAAAKYIDENPADATPEGIATKVAQNLAKVPGLDKVPIVQTGKAVMEAAAREQSAFAQPIVNLQQERQAITPFQAMTGPASFLAFTPEQSIYREGYTELGDVFQNMGWSEGSSAVAGLAASLALPSNFMLLGFGGKTLKNSELFTKAKNVKADSISRNGMLKDFADSQAALRHTQSKLANYFKDDLAEETLLTFRREILEAPDAKLTKSIYSEYKQLAKDAKAIKDRTLTPAQRLQKSALKVYNDTISSSRVFNWMDGRKSYRGTNAGMNKLMYAAERNGQVGHHNKTVQIMDTLREKGIDSVSLDDGDLARLTMNSLVEQGNAEGAQTLATSLGLKEIPVLTATDRIILDTVIGVVNQNKSDLAYLFNKISKEAWVDVHNYAFATRYVDEIEPTLNSMIARGGRSPKINEFAKFTERVKNQNVPRHDFFKLVDETIAQQEYFLNVVPRVRDYRQTFEFIDEAAWKSAVKNIKKADPEFVKESQRLRKLFDKGQAYKKEFKGKLNDNLEYWGRHLTAMETRGNINAPASWDAALKAARGNITQATLAFNPSSMLLQGGTAFDAMAFMIPEYGLSASRDLMMELTKTWLKPGYADEVIKASKGLRARTGAGEEIIKLLDSEVAAFSKAKTINELKKSLKGSKLQKAKKLNMWLVQKGMSGLKGFDMRTAAGVQSALKKVLKKHGIKNIDDEADYLMTLINASPDVSMRPMILNYGEGAKAVFTFKTFFLYRWSLLTHDLVGGIISPGSYQKKMLSLFSTGLLMAGQVAEDEARRVIYETITGADLPDVSLSEQVMFSTLENIPFFGDIAGALLRGRDAQVPLVRQLTNAAKGIGGVVTAKTTRGKQAAAIRTVKATGSLAGVAGSGIAGSLAKRLTPRPKAKVKRKQSRTQKLRASMLRGLK